ncbi:phospholipid-translocating P-type ATPase, flippase family protein, putative [Babesia bigemina]|uniref:Phospholipid-transporting ATPase n=1 Tax=Babesia bigemina TaxID=5866 RepID=A0A061DE13_BABBI|nr:phospholipid-translocating P-type ATPase, flippase family protein, putative [Babesia bigemina]CDR96755.1 phospholipid-translocating P-type ATPase, flippase family protein, putative [Babesia bigemina]|eukprot:XP_012768941.1 phospholipid-translocating P-type ATPase, flippase family protein, putative [Babesia bigemina]
MWPWLSRLFGRQESEPYEGKVYLVTNYSEHRGTVYEPFYVPVQDSFLSRHWTRLLDFFERCFRRKDHDSTVSTEAAADEANRLAFLRGSRRSNFIRTTKYSLLSFLPRVLLFQMTRLGNLIFLGVSFLQLIKEVSDSNGLPTYLIPVVFVVAVCVARELASDLARWRNDREENGRTVHVFRGGKLLKMKQQDICVGDIVKVHAYEYFPSDLVLLNCCDEHGVCNIETKNADGESNVKYKHVVPKLAALFRNDEEAARAQIKIVCEPPSDNLNSFSGMAYYTNDDADELQASRLKLLRSMPSLRGDPAESLPEIGTTIHKVQLHFDQLLLRGTSMVNTQWAYCVAVYVGHQTRLLKGSIGSSRRKNSKLEGVYQRNMFTVMIIMFGCVLISALMGVYWQLTMSADHDYLHVSANSSAWRTFLVTCGSMMLLLAAMIPVDLIILWEVVRMAESWQIRWNPEMVSDGKRAESRSDQLIEDLAHVTHIYTDKTGTLTQNVMTLKALGFGAVGNVSTPRCGEQFWSMYNRQDPEIRKMLREFVLVGSLCHSVVIRKVNGEEIKRRPERVLKTVDGATRLVAIDNVPVEYDAASPDELALLNGIAELGCVFTNRRTVTEIDISLVTPEAQKLMLSTEDYELWLSSKEDGYVPALRFTILDAVAFDSSRKCMSVVVQGGDGRILTLCKGADSALLSLLRSTQHIKVSDIQEQLHDFATVGLRTLVFAVRELSAPEYQAWHESYATALLAGESRDDAVANVVADMERDMKLVGCSGIEDLLQEDVGDVIRDLKEAGILIWVLTGDKLETALSIGRSTNIVDDDTCNAVLSDPDPHVVSSEIAMHILNCVGPSRMGSKSELPVVRSVFCNICAVEVPEPQQRRRRSSAPEFSKFCVTVTGEVLQTVYADEELKAQFFRLAQLAGVVIACRMTHKQKFLLTRDNSKLNAYGTSLAIGDGANDVDMILAADVGVGIDGREGHQACRSADFTIAQFRFLRQLLFVHGREALRKNKFLLYFCIFRNFSFSFVNVIYNFQTGFSGVSVFNTWSKQVINLFFTSFPLMFYVILDREVPHTLLTRYPILYNTWSTKPVNQLVRYLLRSLGSNWLSKRWHRRLEHRRGVYDPVTFWSYLLAALWLSVFEVLIILSFTDTTDVNCRDGSPLNLGFSLFSQAMYVHHVLAVNGIVCLVSKSWYWLNHFSVWGETAIMIICWIIVSLVPAFAFVPEAHVFLGTFETLHSSLAYYGAIILSLVVTLFPFWGYLFYTAVFNQSLENRIAIALKRGTFNGISLSRRNSVAYIANAVVPRVAPPSGFAFAIDQGDALMALIQRTIHKIFMN